MIEKNAFIAVLFLLWGIISVVRPEIILKFRSWMSKKFFGATYKPTHKTEIIQRIMGVFFIIAALIITDVI